MIFAPRGSGALGIDWADVEARYRTLMPQARVSDQNVEASLQVIHDFARVKNVSGLTGLLRR